MLVDFSGEVLREIFFATDLYFGSVLDSGCSDRGCVSEVISVGISV